MPYREYHQLFCSGLFYSCGDETVCDVDFDRFVDASPSRRRSFRPFFELMLRCVLLSAATVQTTSPSTTPSGAQTRARVGTLPLLGVVAFGFALLV